jgi:protein phosphatase
MTPTPIKVASCSDKGLVRQTNEDAIETLPEVGVVLLADGMGGYNAGNVASRLAVDTVASNLLDAMKSSQWPPSPGEAVAVANGAILEAVGQKPELEGMATTLVLGLFYDTRFHYGHVGDSRIYRYRDNALERLTRDHSMIQELVDQGLFESVEAAREAGVKNNILTRGVGIDRQVEVDIGSHAARDDDIYLFCSDGLSNMVQDPEIEQILRELDGDLAGASERLIGLALENGGLDNVSVVLAQPAG